MENEFVAGFEASQADGALAKALATVSEIDADDISASELDPQTVSDLEQLMQPAIREAKVAATAPRRDIPIGAAVYSPEGELLAVAGNRRELDEDPTAHAEILALRQAAEATGRWNLSGCTLAVTLEPCTMCAGAIVLARIKLLLVSAMDPKAGATGSLYNLVQEPRLNHRVQMVRGVCGEECGQLLKDFFRQLRAEKKQARAKRDGAAAEIGALAKNGSVAKNRSASLKSTISDGSV